MKELIGKEIKDYFEINDSIRIEFTDGSYFTVELDSVNNSCHCHPEYEYYLSKYYNPA